MTIYVTAIRYPFDQDKFDKLNDYKYFTKIGKTLHNCYKRNRTNWLFERDAIREIDLSPNSSINSLAHLRLYNLGRLERQQLAWEIDVNWDMLNLIEATALTMADKKFGHSPSRIIRPNDNEEKPIRYPGHTECFNMTILQGREIVLEAIDRISKAFPEYKI